MAFRNNKSKGAVKPPTANDPSEVEKIQKLTSVDAAHVLAAARKLFGNPDRDRIANNLLDDTLREVDDMDLAFDEEEKAMNTDVKILEIGPNGQLTDVTGRVSPRSLRPEQIADFRLDGRSLPTGSDGRIDKAAALDLLSQIMGKERGNTKDAAMKRMEATLAESDRILEHWKK